MNSGAEVKALQTPDMQLPIVTKKEDEKPHASAGSGAAYRALRRMMERKKTA